MKISKIVQVSSVIAALVMVHAPAAHAFGISGDNGYDGSSGQDGSSGDNVTLFADGTPVVENLSGTDGSDAGDAQPGSSASSCYQDRGDYNMSGADGGNGGSGGRGGDGGNGGDITVYYTDLGNLQKILVYSEGGSPGRGGRGAPGGNGCECSVHEWEERECTNNNTVSLVMNKDDDDGHDHDGDHGGNHDGDHDGDHDGNQQTCREYTYYCTDGSNGSYGSDGSSGSSGSRGTAYLVNRKEPLAPVNPSDAFDLGTLGNGATVALSDNEWSGHSGAASLFAPGSILSDTYYHWDGRIDVRSQLLWKAQRPATDFAGEQVRTALNGDQVEFDVPSNIWVDSAQATQGDLTTLTITKAFRESETTQLQLGGLTGEQANLVLALTDQANISNDVKTQVHLELAIKHWLFFYTTQFKGDVPANLVTVQGNQIQVALGKLPLNVQKWFQKGKKLRIRMSVTRSFNGYSADQNFQQTKIKVP